MSSSLQEQAHLLMLSTLRSNLPVIRGNARKLPPSTALSVSQAPTSEKGQHRQPAVASPRHTLQPVTPPKAPAAAVAASSSAIQRGEDVPPAAASPPPPSWGYGCREVFLLGDDLPLLSSGETPNRATLRLGDASPVLHPDGVKQNNDDDDVLSPGTTTARLAIGLAIERAIDTVANPVLPGTAASPTPQRARAPAVLSDEFDGLDEATVRRCEELHFCDEEDREEAKGRNSSEEKVPAEEPRQEVSSEPNAVENAAADDDDDDNNNRASSEQAAEEDHPQRRALPHQLSSALGTAARMFDFKAALESGETPNTRAARRQMSAGGGFGGGARRHCSPVRRRRVQACEAALFPRNEDALTGGFLNRPMSLVPDDDSDDVHRSVSHHAGGSGGIDEEYSDLAAWLRCEPQPTVELRRNASPPRAALVDAVAPDDFAVVGGPSTTRFELADIEATAREWVTSLRPSMDQEGGKSAAEHEAAQKSFREHHFSIAQGPPLVVAPVETPSADPSAVEQGEPFPATPPRVHEDARSPAAAAAPTPSSTDRTAGTPPRPELKPTPPSSSPLVIVDTGKPDTAIPTVGDPARSAEKTKDGESYFVSFSATANGNLSTAPEAQPSKPEPVSESSDVGFVEGAHTLPFVLPFWSSVPPPPSSSYSLGQGARRRQKPRLLVSPLPPSEAAGTSMLLDGWPLPPFAPNWRDAKAGRRRSPAFGHI